MWICYIYLKLKSNYQCFRFLGLFKGKWASQIYSSTKIPISAMLLDQFIRQKFIKSTYMMNTYLKFQVKKLTFTKPKV